MRSPFAFTCVLIFFGSIVIAAEPRIELESCALEGLGSQARCATYEVYEDRLSKSGRRIPINIVVLPARQSRKEPDPVFILFGGPGEAAASNAQMVSKGFEALLESRDIVLVDQRGTGGSNGFECRFYDNSAQAMLGSIFNVNRVRLCRQEILRQADPRFYTTEFFIEDLEEVRKGLGYDRINLIGGSYGSRAAMIYMKKHPESIRSAAISGVSPPNQLTPSSYARDAEESMKAVFDACAADAQCASKYPQPKSDLDQVIARLGKGPVEATIQDADGKDVTVRLERDAYAERLRLLLYSPEMRKRIPELLNEAANGNFAPFAQIAYDFSRQIIPAVNFGLLLSVTCAEEIPFIEVEKAMADAENTFYGAGRLRDQIAACREWPAARLSRDVTKLVSFDGPVLMIDGELDPVTPPYWARQAATKMPNSRVIVIPNETHLGGSCETELLVDFIRKGSAKNLNTSCVDQ